MNIRLEHANITVRDIDAMMRFLVTAFPAFQIRQDKTEADGRRWVHMGHDGTYIALNQATSSAVEKRVPYQGDPGINHLGYEVDNVDSLRERLVAGGYRDSTYPNEHPFRKRVYFYDDEGNDWEFIQYLSEDVSMRNDYQLPDEK
jgi:catechol 2,3-dioxygenase-like lactoylglutathione lyase family enzyme